MAKKVSSQCPCYQTINKANFEANLVSMAKKVSSRCPWYQTITKANFEENLISKKILCPWPKKCPWYQTGN